MENKEEKINLGNGSTEDVMKGLKSFLPERKVTIEDIQGYIRFLEGKLSKKEKDLQEK